jgi:hypothetical protein
LLVFGCGCGRLGFDARSDALAGSGDGAPGDAAVTACNQLHTVHDDFSGGLDLDLWGGTFTDPGTAIDVQSGEVILTPASNAASSAYSGLGTARYYDGRGERFFAEVTQVGSNGSVTGIQIRRGVQQLALAHYNGMLRASEVAPTFTTILQRPYSASTDRFWAISEFEGTISWETSVDGISFSTLVQAAAPFDMSLVRGQLFAGTETSVASPGTLHVTSVGSSSALPAAVCSSDDLVETFDASVLDGKWLNSFIQPCCSMAPVAGQLVVQTDGSPGYAMLRSASGYDLRGRHVGVELVQAATQPSIQQSLVVQRDPQNRVAIIVTTSSYNAYEVINGTAASHSSTRMPGERFFRIGESGGMYTAEASTDQQTWRVLRSAPVTFGYDNVIFQVETGLQGAAGSPETIVWDNFNAP